MFYKLVVKNMFKKTKFYSINIISHGVFFNLSIPNCPIFSIVTISDIKMWDTSVCVGIFVHNLREFTCNPHFNVAFSG